MRTVIGHTIPLQVAFVGPLGVGKSTAVRALSDVPVVNTDVARSGIDTDPGRQFRKRTTTVGIDYGEYTSATGQRVSLLGTPGQVRFESARASALAGRTRIVLWLYGDHELAVAECAEWLDYLGQDVWDRLTVAVTRRQAGVADLSDFRKELDARRPGIPLTEGDPRDARSVADVVELALGHLANKEEAR